MRGLKWIPHLLFAHMREIFHIRGDISKRAFITLTFKTKGEIELKLSTNFTFLQPFY